MGALGDHGALVLGESGHDVQHQPGGGGIIDGDERDVALHQGGDEGDVATGAGQSVSYTSFNRAAAVSASGATAAFTYDSEHARITQTLTQGSTITTTTYLNDPASGAMSEKVVSTAGIQCLQEDLR